MSEHERVAARILERLAGPQSRFRTELAELLADQLLAERARDAIDFERVHAVILQSLRTPNVRRIVQDHVAPGFARYADAIAQDDVTVGSLVDATAHEKLHRLARAVQLPEARWTEHALDPALVRQLLRPVWTQVLSTFAKRLPVPFAGPAAGGRGAPSGLTGLLARSVQESAEKLLDRGRSVMGGLGAEVERRLATAARDFSDSAAQAFRAGLIERLQSEEGRELLGQILAGFVDHVLRTRFSELQRDVDVLPVAELFDVVPDLVGHGAQSRFVREIVDRELSAWLRTQGERRLGELLEDFDLRQPVRALLVQHIGALAGNIASAQPFADWISRLVRPDETE